MSRRSKAVGAILVLLIAAVIAQVRILGGLRRPIALDGPVLGQPIPDIGQVSVNRGPGESSLKVLNGRGECLLLVIVDPGCAFCHRMGPAWRKVYEAWADSINYPIQSAWLGAGESAPLELFFHAYDGGNALRIRAMADPRRVGRLLGVYATPMTYLLDRSGRLRVGVLGDQLPPIDSARAACA